MIAGEAQGCAILICQPGSLWFAVCTPERPWVWSQSAWFFGDKVQGAEIVQERSINGNQGRLLEEG